MAHEVWNGASVAVERSGDCAERRVRQSRSEDATGARDDLWHSLVRAQWSHAARAPRKNRSDADTKRYRRGNEELRYCRSRVFPYWRSRHVAVRIARLQSCNEYSTLANTSTHPRCLSATFRIIRLYGASHTRAQTAAHLQRYPTRIMSLCE